MGGFPPQGGSVVIAQSRIVRHVGLPSLPSLALIGLYFVPKATFGCANRGWIAVAIALGSMAAAYTCLVFVHRLRKTDIVQARWWILTGATLLLPTLLLFRLG
jgi:hypothetical protein